MPGDEQKCQGGHKIVTRCNLPLTGIKVVDMIVTDKAVIDVTAAGLVLRELAVGETIEGVIEATGAELLIAENIGAFA